MGGFLCAKCLFVAKVEQMQKNRAKSAILPHKHRINNVPGRKDSFSQHTVGLFPWAHCKPTNADIGGPPMWHKHIWRSVRKEEKSKPRKITAQGREIHAVFFLQVTMHLSCLPDSLVIDLVLVPEVDLLLPVFGPITKQRTSIKN